MKLKTRIILGFTMIILVPLILFAATLYGFSQSQSQKTQVQTESGETVYDISITDSADSQRHGDGRVDRVGHFFQFPSAVKLGNNDRSAGGKVNKKEYDQIDQYCCGPPGYGQRRFP